MTSKHNDPDDDVYAELPEHNGSHISDETNEPERIQIPESVLNRLPSPLHKIVANIYIEKGKWELIQDELS